MSHTGAEGLAEPFCESHRPLLALLAYSATRCVETRAAESVFGSLCSAEPSLIAVYPEVGVLHEVYQIRCALRNLQECPLHLRPTFYDTVQNSLKCMHDLLPDPLLLVIVKAMEVLQENPSMCRVLESHLLGLVEHIQLVVLRETKSLQRRGERITLQLRDVPPFVS